MGNACIYYLFINKTGCKVNEQYYTLSFIFELLKKRENINQTPHQDYEKKELLLHIKF